ncbi:hypothetical protein BJX63DRAFT_164281 [Aspergillus granulosus]|uniref:Azaphilone pigments biosynthesis cluster protein L N-terminal domain-containing protein n=1 Tax=Aspergillus granulosus TaxID=176169 RepID=A0ABR4HIL3_9EURO
MGDPLSVASGVIALSGFALQATKSLFQTIEGIRSSKRSARELRDEVEALLQTLEVLTRLVTEYKVELSALKLPLFQCGVVCQELSDLISRCVKHPDGQKTSLRDWTRLQYRGEDITNYKNVLCNYKATINIALGGATFQSVAVTRQVLQDYKDMIKNTTADLQDRLDEIEDKLKSSSLPDEPNTATSREEVQKIEEERQSTTLCLEICKQVSGYIELYQFKRDGVGQAASPPQDNKAQANPNLGIARQIAQNSLTSCLQNMNAASARLQEHLNQLEASLKSTGNPPASYQVTCELQRIKEERETISHCLNICSDASSLSESTRMNIFEDISSLDDAQQVMVSTIGELLNAKRITTGMRSLQLMGQMSDETIQYISSRHISPGEKVEVGIEEDNRDNFKDRYGTGRPLRNERSGQMPGNIREHNSKPS